MTMQIIQYQTEEEAQAIILAKSNEGLTLVEVQNITEGNFLGFTAILPPPTVSLDERISALENARLADMLGI